MKRWFLSILLIVAAMAALTVGASAEVVTRNNIQYENDTVVGTVNKNITTAQILAEVDGVPITKIAPNAFDSCTNLTSVEIGSNIKTIGESAFLNCRQLKTVFFSDSVDTIEANAFLGCQTLNEVALPNSLKEIKSGTFANCYALSSIYIASVEKIEQGAFLGDTKLTCLHVISTMPEENVTQEDSSALLVHKTLVAQGEETPPKCAVQGIRPFEYYCMSTCGSKFNFTQNRPIPATGHPDDKQESRTQVPATCVATGRAVGTYCTACNTFISGGEELPIDPDNHYDDEGLWAVVTVDAKPATCTEAGKEAGEECSLCGTPTEGRQTIDPLGHTYDEFYKNELKGLVEKEMNHNPEYKSCTEFYVPDARKCDRYDVCGTMETEPLLINEALNEELKEKLSIDLGRTGHEWNNTPPASEDDSRITEIKPATCENDGTDGYIDWTETCNLCGTEATDLNRQHSEKVVYNGTHTYYKGNQHIETIPATCWRDGYEVTYLVCDGNHSMENCSINPAHKYHEECSVGDGNQCDSLLDAIEKARADYKEEADNPAPDETKLENLKDALDAVLDAYDAHLEKHEPGGENDCIVEKKTISHEGLADDTSKNNHAGPFTEEETSWTDLNGNPITKQERDCTKGYIEIATTTCLYCGTEITVSKETVKPHDHTPQDVAEEDIKIIPANCTEPERKLYPDGTICTECEQPIHGDPIPVVGSKPLGHKWVFESDEAQEDHCRVVTGRVHCEREYEEGCGATSETRTIAVSGKLGHTWGAWTTTKQPTATEEGEETHYCEVCYKYDETAFETRKIPATGVPDDGDGDDGSGGSGSGGGSGDDGSGGSGSGGGTTTPDTNYYTISRSTDGHGTVSTSVSSARSGTRVTVYVYPDSGYQVDKVRVTGNTFGTDLSNGWYSFTMPAENVTVTATFSRVSSRTNVNWTGSATSSSQSSSTTQNVVQSVPKAGAWGQIFSDIPASHWAAGEINWANQMGYMNGTSGGGFNPNGNITHQQMWMVLARLTGNNPANMADARRWAVNGGFADGSAPEGAVNRHQLVTALYRCAHLMGTSNRNTASLAGFPDSRTVPAGARDAFAWAVANGIIGGNANGRLDPNGTLTRAQFAVILYRFSQRV